MYKDQKVIVVLPAYNAAKTVLQTYREIPMDIVDEVILCDDKSTDNTVEVARTIGIRHILVHDENRGYGGNQKSLYEEALRLDGEIIVMLHPDYQYTPKLIRAMVSIIGNKLFPVVLGSRILGKGALKGGMPIYKYVANRVLTFFQNILSNYKLSEYHTGYRAYNRQVLETIPFAANSDNFIFDNQVLSQIIYAGFQIGEISCPAKYFEEASSINLINSMEYGLGVLKICVLHFLARTGIYKSRIYKGLGK